MVYDGLNVLSPSPLVFAFLGLPIFVPWMFSTAPTTCPSGLYPVRPPGVTIRIYVSYVHEPYDPYIHPLQIHTYDTFVAVADVTYI